MEIKIAKGPDKPKEKFITTTKGLLKESLLEKREGVVDNDNENTNWVEYWGNGELVHRSAHVTLKNVGVLANALIGSFKKEK